MIHLIRRPLHISILRRIKNDPLKLSHLIKNNSWLSIKLVFLELYPDEIKSIQSYESIFENLSILHPEGSVLEIIIRHQTDSFDGESYVEVCGKSLDKQDTQLYALDFTPWAEWLDMEISKETIVAFTELEIISHCLFEMTFIGFDEETIKHELKKLDDQIKELDNMTPEEKKKNLIPWEDVKKELENKFKGLNS